MGGINEDGMHLTGDISVSLKRMREENIIE
jgi:hypothetical protein